MGAASLALVLAEVLFAVTSIVFEAYIVFDIDIAARAGTDWVAYLWQFYAESFDPVFLAPPPLLKLMCAFDMFIFGPFHVICAIALWQNKSWINIPSIAVNRWVFCGD
jgi:hypothetical protein